MSKLRSFYNIYQVIEKGEEEYIETLEMSTVQIRKYIEDLKKATHEPFLAKLALLLVRKEREKVCEK